MFYAIYMYSLLNIVILPWGESKHENDHLIIELFRMPCYNVTYQNRINPLMFIKVISSAKNP